MMIRTKSTHDVSYRILRVMLTSNNKLSPFLLEELESHRACSLGIKSATACPQVQAVQFLSMQYFFYRSPLGAGVGLERTCLTLFLLPSTNKIEIYIINDEQ